MASAISSVGTQAGPEQGRTLGFVKPQYVLVLFLIIGFGLRLAVAVFSPSMHFPDEIFQTLEPAHRLAFGPGIVTWEYHVGLRSWVFPGALAAVMRATAWIGPGSVGYLLGVKAIMSLLSLTTVYFAYKIGERVFGTGVGVLCAGMCALWYHLIYFAPRALSEVVAGHLLLPAIYLAVFASGEKIRRDMFLAGVLCAFAFMFRLQLAPAVGVVALYCCGTRWRTHWAPMICGMVPVIAIFGIADWIGWSYPFQSMYLNFSINLLQHRAAEFGVQPFDFYVGKLVTYFNLVIVFSIIGGVVVRRTRLLAYTVLAVVIPHSMLAHKEVRFIYPAFPILLILAGLGIWECALWIAANTRRTTAWASACVLLLPVVAVGITHTRKVDWRYQTGALAAMQQLSHTPDACGVAFRGIDWGDSGGYTYLHRDLPLFFTSLYSPHIPLSGRAEERVEDWMDFEKTEPGFNYVISADPLTPARFRYRPMECWDAICLYKRSGGCKPIPGYSTNELLRLMTK